jgi:hypothetical protein
MNISEKIQSEADSEYCIKTRSTKAENQLHKREKKIVIRGSERERKKD